MDDKSSPWQIAGSYLKILIESWGVFTSTVIFFLTLGAGGIIGGFIGVAKQQILWIVIGFGSAAVLGVASIFAITRANKRRGYNVKIKEKYVTYRYYPDGKTMEHTKRYRIIALRDNVEEFVDRYRWSCDKVGAIKVVLLSHQSQRMVEDRENEARLNRIIFEPSLKRAEQAEVFLRWDLYCAGSPVHFLSQPVDYPTDYLELSVFVPYKPTGISFVHFNTLGGQLSDQNTIEEEKPANDKFNPATGEIRYTIRHPKFGHKYLIKWTPPRPLDQIIALTPYYRMLPKLAKMFEDGKKIQPSKGKARATTTKPGKDTPPSQS